MHTTRMLRIINGLYYPVAKQKSQFILEGVHLYGQAQQVGNDESKH